MNFWERHGRAVGWTFLRWMVAGVFIYAGTLKLEGAAEFAASISRFQMLPEFLIHPMALALPPLEILSGIALMVGPWKRQAAFGLALLCTMFLAAFASAEVRGISVECTCFGASVADPMWVVIARDVILLAVSLAIYRKCLRDESPSDNEQTTQIGVLKETY